MPSQILSKQWSLPVGRWGPRGGKRPIQSYMQAAGHWSLNSSLPPILPHRASVLPKHPIQDTCTLVEESQGSCSEAKPLREPGLQRGAWHMVLLRVSCPPLPLTPEPGLP